MWSLTVRQLAEETAAEALDAVRVGDVLGALPAGVAQALVVAQYTGYVWDPWVYGQAAVYRLAGLVEACVAAAGVTLGAALPAPFPFAGPEPYPAGLPPSDVVVGSPFVGDRGLARWTGKDLLDAWVGADRLSVSAAYAAYPSADLVLAVSRPAASDPAELPPAVDGLLGDDWARSTEPAVDDGEPVGDLGVVYHGGVDGSWTGGARRPAIPPLDDAVYAAPSWAVGPEGDGPDELGVRRAVLGDVVELSWKLGLVSGDADRSVVAAGPGAVALGPPVVMPALGADAVYVWSVNEVGGEWLAVEVRTYSSASDPPPADLRHELWAREIFARLAAETASQLVVSGTLLAPALVAPSGGAGSPDAPYAPALGDLARGLSLEGRPYAVRRWVEDEHGVVDLEMARPVAVPAPARGPRPDPAVDFVSLAFDSAAKVAEFAFGVLPSAQTPRGWEVEATGGPPTPTDSGVQLAVRGARAALDLSGSDEGDVVGLRARARWDDGSYSAWAEATVTVRSTVPPA